MDKKRKYGRLLSVICTVAVLAMVIGCGTIRLSGSYKNEMAGNAFGIDYSLGSMTYTFSGLNKVKIENEVTLIGSQKTSREGTYEIADNKITFTFTEEVTNDDGTVEKKEETETHSFYKGEDTIKIDDVEFTKVK